MDSVEDVLNAIDALDCDRKLKDVLKGIIALVDNGDLNIGARVEHHRTAATKKAYGEVRKARREARAADGGARDEAEGDWMPPPSLKVAKRPKGGAIPKNVTSDLPESLRRLAASQIDYDSSS